MSLKSPISAASSELPPYLTIDEWRRIVRVGRSAAYEMVRRGDLPVLRVGRLLRIPRSAIEPTPLAGGNGDQVLR